MDSLSYTYDVSKLWLGAHYGNLEIHARTDAQSNLVGLWRAVDDQFYCGRMKFSFRNANQLVPAQTTIFRPSNQTTIYNGAGVEVTKTFFTPYGTEDDSCVYTMVKAHNTLDEPTNLLIEVGIHYPLFVGAEYVKMPEPIQLEKRVRSELKGDVVVTRTLGHEDEVRLLGCSARLMDHRFSDRTTNLVYEVGLAAGEEREVCFLLLISGAGLEEAEARFERAMQFREIFEQTEVEFGAMIAKCDVATPDPMLNRAIKWSKVNMIRDQRRFPIGLGFTNDPPQDILVVRDVAWFTVGCDYFVPEFSRGSLEVVREHGIEPGGELTEYILASSNPPYISNYGLNINDDTPLYIFAVHHHYGLTKDRAYLEAMYETVRNAAYWIIAQERDGLIWCTSEESNLWGICSWRNVIPGYQLSGAVTEINAECYMALRLASRCAEALGETEDSERFLQAALKLRDNINQQLVSEKTGVYLLNIDNSGVRHHDLTGDMIFPVLFGVSTEELKVRVLDLLSGPQFWTEYGVRTVAPGQPNYDPERSLQLLGGVWPNLTAWVGYAARTHRPELVVEAMRNVYRMCETPEPIAFKNVVPGQFPERLNGATFESSGMALSPWVAPTYLWLAMDGLVGFRPNLDRLIVQPNLPDSWHWVAVRKFPYAGELYSLFMYNGILYSTLDVQSDAYIELFDQDVTDQIESNAYVIGLRRSSGLTIFVCAGDEQTVHIKLSPPLVEREHVVEMKLASGEARIITF